MRRRHATIATLTLMLMAIATGAQAQPVWVESSIYMQQVDDFGVSFRVFMVLGEKSGNVRFSAENETNYHPWALYPHPVDPAWGAITVRGVLPLTPADASGDHVRMQAILERPVEGATVTIYGDAELVQSGEVVLGGLSPAGEGPIEAGRFRWELPSKPLERVTGTTIRCTARFDHGEGAYGWLAYAVLPEDIDQHRRDGGLGIDFFDMAPVINEMTEEPTPDVEVEITLDVPLLVTLEHAVFLAVVFPTQNAEGTVDANQFTLLRLTDV